MSLCESDLFLDRASVPSVEAIVCKVADYGHKIAFPAGFSFAEPLQAIWLAVVLDGEKTGFDYGNLPREEYEGTDPDRPVIPDFGDTALAFVARHRQSSTLAMSLVQRAICELTDARGWWQEGEECLGNEDMIAFCTATIAAAKAHPEPLPAARSRFGRAYFRDLGKVLIGSTAVLGGAAIVIFLMGYFFAPGAPQ